MCHRVAVAGARAGSGLFAEAKLPTVVRTAQLVLARILNAITTEEGLFGFGAPSLRLSRAGCGAAANSRRSDANQAEEEGGRFEIHHHCGGIKSGTKLLSKNEMGRISEKLMLSIFCGYTALLLFVSTWLEICCFSQSHKIEISARTRFFLCHFQNTSFRTLKHFSITSHGRGKQSQQLN